MRKKILGLDPGIAILGFGTIACQVVDSTVSQSSSSLVVAQPKPTVEPVKLLDFGVIETNAKTSLGDRLCTIYNDLHTLVNEVNPDLVAVEKLFFYRMSHTITVAQARGVLMLVLAQHSLPYVEFAPPQIKQALTGHGNSPKIEVQEAVARELSLDFIPQPDDAADALAIAITAWFHEC